MDIIGTITGALFAVVFAGGVPAYIVLQQWTLMRFRGGWRIAAMVPLLGAIPTIAWSLYALSRDSNLWPLTFIFFAPLGALYLIILLFVRRTRTGSFGL
ncbi:MAG TPA: hypothetical protein VG309_09050 [Rhizomicrobium sp.]|nr:hypothetical protein [Rhizomicrobium sp.]